MAAFNTLTVTRLAPCPRCAAEGPIRLQFVYGDTWQYEFALHDSIRWGGNGHGERADLAECVAYPEKCGMCGADTPGEYVLTVRHDRLVAYRLATQDDLAQLEQDSQ